jgi:hypothetical protein
LKLSTAEPGIRVDPGSGAKALFADLAGVPAVIVRDHGRGRTVYLNLDITDYHRWRLRPPEDTDCRELIFQLTRAAGVKGEYAVRKADGSYLPAVEIFPFVNGRAKIIAIHRNPQLRVNELGPPKYRSNKLFQRPEPIQVDLGARYAVYDVRTGTSLGSGKKLKLRLDPWTPTILALFPRAVRGLKLVAPARAARGKAIAYKVSILASQPAARHAYRVQLAGPNGQVLPLYSRNIIGARGKASGTIYLALSDPAGRYTLAVRDVATGKTASKRIVIE